MSWLTWAIRTTSHSKDQEPWCLGFVDIATSTLHVVILFRSTVAKRPDSRRYFRTSSGYNMRTHSRRNKRGKYIDYLELLFMSSDPNKCFRGWQSRLDLWELQYVNLIGDYSPRSYLTIVVFSSVRIKHVFVIFIEQYTFMDTVSQPERIGSTYGTYRQKRHQTACFPLYEFLIEPSHCSV